MACLSYTPWVSEVVAGRRARRRRAYIAAGGWAWPRRGGRAVFPGVKPLAAEILKRVLRPLHIL